MADSVIFIGWNRAVAGKEQEAIGLFSRSLEYYGKLQSEGRIESFEAVGLNPHGGDLNGFVLIRGDAEKLFQIQQEDQWLDFTVEGSICVEGLGAITGYTGEGMQNQMARRLRILGA
jgi:hypothetical protein